MHVATAGEGGIWDFPLFQYAGTGCAVCLCVGGKCGAEKKLGYILNNFRSTLLDFEGFFSKPKELLETSVNIFFSLFLSILI